MRGTRPHGQLEQHTSFQSPSQDIRIRSRRFADTDACTDKFTGNLNPNNRNTLLLFSPRSSPYYSGLRARLLSLQHGPFAFLLSSVLVASLSVILSCLSKLVAFALSASLRELEAR